MLLRALAPMLTQWLAVATFAASSTAAASTISIRTDVNPGTLQAGDSLTFTFAVDWIAPPSGYQWESLNVKSFQITFGTQVESVFTGCENVSGLSPQVFPPPEFASGFGCAAWTWVPYAPQPTSGLRGDLFKVTARFTQPGVYTATLTAPAASFFRGKEVLAQPLVVSPARIVITVGERR
jgi:hypothetical protein